MMTKGLAQLKKMLNQISLRQELKEETRRQLEMGGLQMTTMTMASTRKTTRTIMNSEINFCLIFFIVV